MIISFFCIIFIFLAVEAKANPKDLNVKTFGTAIKNGHLTTTETTIFEYSAAGGGVVTEMWMTGGWEGFEDTQVRIYIDGETQPSIDYQLYLAHGIGWGDDSTWQGNEYVGKNAHGGGIYHTYRIPFGSSITVTANLAFPANNVFWFIIRGLENMPVFLGDLQLPSSARLKLYKNENVTLQPQELTTLSTSASGGALLMVTIQAQSVDLNYLEACFRAYIDGSSTPQFLSSGTEDFFLSAFYFNGGQYETSQSGLTHFDTAATKLSMYKFFWRDPVVFSTGLKLVWKNMENGDCPSGWPPKFSEENEEVLKRKSAQSERVAPMTYTSYVWVYEWD